MNRFQYLLLCIVFPVFQPVWAVTADAILSAEKAFVASTDTDHDSIVLGWDIAAGYYLYRDKFKFQVANTSVTLGAPEFPRGKIKQDPYFGDVEIYRNRVSIRIPVATAGQNAFTLSVTAQGCADAGVCYPPMKREWSFHPDDFNSLTRQQTPVNQDIMQPAAEQDRIARALQQDTLFWTAFSFFGFGLLLSFTPCCLPMIPILSGIIVGQGGPQSTARAFMLSLVYVLTSALTYTLFGVLAGLFGHNLQAVFQNPWIISAFSAVFVLLSLSMFGLYSLQFPASLQSRISGFSQHQQSGNFIGVGIMGILSALIVGPCVAPPLAGALIYIGQSGDAVLGGIALFMMGLGMGAPLLAIGTSAGKFLPEAGVWMESVKAVFGVLLLAVAVWLLSRIIPATVSLMLWALLLIIPAIYLGAIDTLPPHTGGWHKMRKGVGVVLLLYGSALFIGVLSGSNDPLQPLKNLAGDVSSRPSTAKLAFTRIKSSRELNEHIQTAAAQQKWLMLDFYADWCTSCVEMERETFMDPSVQQALSQLHVIQADVTTHSDHDKKLLRRFGLIGPPAVLFFSPDGEEQRSYRSVGFKNPAEFTDIIKTLLSQSHGSGI